MKLIIELICYSVIIILVCTALTSCETLEPQNMYCEIVFAYDVNSDLPETISKNKIGCACATKDILKGETISGWAMYPLESCRRIRGWHPIRWVDVIDPYFQLEYQKKAKKKK